MGEKNLGKPMHTLKKMPLRADSQEEKEPRRRKTSKKNLNRWEGRTKESLLPKKDQPTLTKKKGRNTQAGIADGEGAGKVDRAILIRIKGGRLKSNFGKIRERIKTTPI